MQITTCLEGFDTDEEPEDLQDSDPQSYEHIEAVVGKHCVWFLGVGLCFSKDKLITDIYDKLY